MSLVIMVGGDGCGRNDDDADGEDANGRSSDIIKIIMRIMMAMVAEVLLMRVRLQLRREEFLSIVKGIVEARTSVEKIGNFVRGYEGLENVFTR